MLKVSNAESSKRDCFGNVHEEFQYLRLINDILDEGSMEEGRNGKAKLYLEQQCILIYQIIQFQC